MGTCEGVDRISIIFEPHSSAIIVSNKEIQDENTLERHLMQFNTSVVFQF